jgi:Zn-dependent protease with chaperone function
MDQPPISSHASREPGEAVVPPPLPAAPGNTQWEGSFRPVVITIAVLAVLAIASCRYAVPVLAGAAAQRVPEAMVDVVGEQVLVSFDAGTFEPSTIDPARQAAIARRFSQLRFPGGVSAGDFEIVFRRSAAVGANAMALPSGTIVVTDGLVELAGNDEEIVAVLAHEAGHVTHRHGLRLLFQSSFASMGLTWLLGDVSAITASVSSALLDAKYSRDFEREADAFAVALLDDNQLSRDHFVRILERLEQSAREAGAIGSGAVPSYLSSHPVTRDRIDAINP